MLLKIYWKNTKTKAIVLQVTIILHLQVLFAHSYKKVLPILEPYKIID